MNENNRIRVMEILNRSQYYDTIITNENNRELMSYIDVLTKKEWKSGKKYFYGHVVV